MRRYDTLLKNTKNAREDLRRRNPGKSEAEIDNIAIKEQIDDLAAKLSDQESFSKMTNYEKRGAMKDYLFLKSMQQPSINAQVGSLLHKDINDDKQLEKLLDKFIEKVPNGKDVLKELNDKQLLFFASSSYLNDDILADQRKKEEMALYEQDLDANGIQGVRVRREAAAEALRKEHAEKEAHLKSMEKLERDIRKKELDDGKKALEEHRKKIRKTANGKIAQAVSHSTVVDPSASSELDELIEEQKEAFKELERKKELSSGPAEPSFNDIIAMRNSSAPKKEFAVEENLDEYRQKTTGLNASKWFMIGHDDSVEIQKLRKASNELEKALETKSFLVDSKMIDAYKASMAYQQKVRKQAGIPFSNKDWKPRSGVGQKRYLNIINVWLPCGSWLLYFRYTAF